MDGTKCYYHDIRAPPKTFVDRPLDSHFAVIERAKLRSRVASPVDAIPA